MTQRVLPLTDAETPMETPSSALELQDTRDSDRTAELRELRTDLQVGRGHVTETNDEAIIALLAAIAAIPESHREFTISTLIVHSETVADVCADPRLRDGIIGAVGGVNGCKLGKLLRVIEGKAIAGLRVARVGDSSAGIVWRVSRV